MLKTATRVRKRPAKARISLTLSCDTVREGHTYKHSSFVGEYELPVSQLDYAVRCGKEVRAKKTW